MCCAPVLRMTRIVLFEFVASLIFTYGTMASYPQNGQYPSMQVAYMSLLMFLGFVVCGQLSGGHGNPIFTVALLMTKGTGVTILNCIVYVLTQFAGAIAGGAIGKHCLIHSLRDRRPV